MTQTSKRCPKCYNSNSLNSKYCSQCAAPLTDPNQSESLSDGFDRHKNTIIITALSTICCFLIVVLLAFSKRPESATQSLPKTLVSANATLKSNSTAAAGEANLPATANKSIANTIQAKTKPVIKTTPTPAQDFDQDVASENVIDTSDDSDDSDYENLSESRYITGPRGGCYYINSNGNKTYVDRSMCGGSSVSSRTSSSGFIRGPRGGCYSITASGRKRYVDRSLCD